MWAANTRLNNNKCEALTHTRTRKRRRKKWKSKQNADMVCRLCDDDNTQNIYSIKWKQNEQRTTIEMCGETSKTYTKRLVRPDCDGVMEMNLFIFVSSKFRNACDKAAVTFDDTLAENGHLPPPLPSPRPRPPPSLPLSFARRKIKTYFRFKNKFYGNFCRLRGAERGFRISERRAAHSRVCLNRELSHTWVCMCQNNK